MHMADALVSPAVGGVMWVATSGLIAYSIKKVQHENDPKSVPLMGVMGAFVFAAQMLNFAIPGTGSSGHLGGGLLLAILLGPYRGFLAMASVLLIQALFFADGGLLAYGCNVFNLGFFPCFLMYPLIYRPLVRNGGRRFPAASLIGAVLGLQLGALAVVVETVASGMTGLSFGVFAMLMQPIHLAIGIVEGLATAAVVGYVWKTRPDLLTETGADPSLPVPSRAGVLAALGVAALVAGSFLSWLASPDPDGLEWALEKAGATEEPEKLDGIHSALASLQENTSFMPDYGFRESPAPGETENGAATEEAWPAVNAGTSLAGIVGSVFTMALVVLLGAAISRLRKDPPDPAAPEA